MKGFLLTAFALTLASALPTDEQRVRRSVETPGFFGGDSEGNGSNSTAEASCTTSAAALSVQMHSFVIEIRELRDSYVRMQNKISRPSKRFVVARLTGNNAPAS